MRIVPFWGSGSFGKSAFVTRERRLNCYFEQRADSDKAPIAVYGTPGLVGACLIPNVGSSPARALYGTETKLYAVASSQYQQIDLLGNSLFQGTMGTVSGLCTIAPGTISQTYILVVDGSTGYVHNTLAGTFSPIASANFPTAPAPNTATCVGGYFVVEQPGTPNFFVSAFGNPTVWNALNVGGAAQYAEVLLAVQNYFGNLVLFAEQHMEIWALTGATPAQPFSPILSATNRWGLAAIFARAECDEALFFLGETIQGGLHLCRLDGLAVRVVSDPDVEYIWTQPGFVRQDAVMLTYQQDRHRIVQLTFPTMNRTFLHDTSTGMMSEAQTGVTTSYAQRHAGNLSAYYAGQSVLSDYLTNQLYTLSPLQFTDNGQTIQRELVTRHAINSFDRFSCSLIYVDFETGVGLTTPVQGYDPVVMMQLSRDNGANWGPESWKKLGKTGKTRTRIVRRRNGSGRSYVMRLKMTDPVKWAITAGALGMRARRQT